MRNHRRYPAPSRTYHVDTGGNDANSGAADKPLQTIAAVNALALRAGDRVLFQRGQTFAGALLPSAASSGKPGRPVTFGSYGSGAAPIISPASGIALTLNTGAHDFTFSGLSFIGAANPAFQVAAGVNPARLTFLSCIFSATGTAKDSFTIDGTTRLLLYACDFSHTAGQGLSGCVLTNVGGGRLVDCTSHHNGTTTSHHGYHVIGGSNIQVTGCTANNNAGHGILVITNAAGVLVDRLKSYLNGASGIQLTTLAAAGNVVRNCLVYSNTASGIRFGADANGITLVHNTIVNNGLNTTTPNIFVTTGTTGNVIKNNISFYDNTVVAAARFPFEVGAAAILSNNTIDYNCWFRLNGAETCQAVNGTQYALAAWQALTGTPDLHSTNANPLLVTAYTDLHLQEGSPCVGTGEALGVPADYDQGQRYAPPSMGAYAATSTYEAGEDMILVDDAGLMLIDDAGLIWTGGV